MWYCDVESCLLINFGVGYLKLIDWNDSGVENYIGKLLRREIVFE